MAVSMQNKLSSAQLRKIKKPIIERKRRERINDSLNQLKMLVLEATQKDADPHSKMEKADILELAVDYFKTVKSSQKQFISRDALPKYQEGFRQCAQEVDIYMQKVDENLSSRIRSHLSQTVKQQQQQQTVTEMNAATPVPEASKLSSLPGVARNSSRIQGGCDLSEPSRKSAVGGGCAMPRTVRDSIRGGCTQPAAPIVVPAVLPSRYVPQAPTFTRVQSYPVQIQARTPVQHQSGLCIQDLGQIDSISRTLSSPLAVESSMKTPPRLPFPSACGDFTQLRRALWRPW